MDPEANTMELIGLKRGFIPSKIKQITDVNKNTQGVKKYPRQNKITRSERTEQGEEQEQRQSEKAERKNNLAKNQRRKSEVQNAEKFLLVSDTSVLQREIGPLQEVFVCLA